MVKYLTMLESRYEYRRRVIPQEPITWGNFITRHQSTRILAINRSGKAEFRAIDLPKEVISTDAKYKIFGEAAQNLRSFLQTHDISSASDNLIDRLMVVNNHDYTVLSLVGKSDLGLGSLGTRLPNRLCVVNADAIIHKASEEKVNFEDLLCMVGTHEITHTLTYQESWINVLKTQDGSFLVDDEKIFRRDGIYTNKPRGSSSPDLNSQSQQGALGLGMLTEGTIQYITDASVSPVQNETLSHLNPHAEITQSIRSMMSQIGERPFIQATFTCEGFRDLYKAVETRYGKGQFRTLLQTISNESLQPLPLYERLRAQGFTP